MTLSGSLATLMKDCCAVSAEMSSKTLCRLHVNMLSVLLASMDGLFVTTTARRIVSHWIYLSSDLYIGMQQAHIAGKHLPNITSSNPALVAGATVKCSARKGGSGLPSEVNYFSMCGISKNEIV